MDEVRDLYSEGRTTKEFKDLVTIFEPLDELFIRNPPENFHKLLDLYMVKIKDLNKLNLDTSAPSTIWRESSDPVTSHFEATKGSRLKVNIDYYCSLVKTNRWMLPSNALYLFKSINLDSRSANSEFMKRKADIISQRLQIFSYMCAAIQFLFTLVVSFRALTVHRHEEIFPPFYVILPIFAFVFALTSPILFMILLTSIMALSKQWTLFKAGGR